ncbi:MAG: molybdopterin biosynthesis protein [Desulfobacterales bacterium]|nr:molybdopterin biosynthesis protein [Desulfobacterales bacterium]
MSSKRNVYLKMKSLAEARKIILDQLLDKDCLATETIPVPDAVGRSLAEPVAAKISSPGFHASAMDGIAVDAASTFGAHESEPKTLIIGKEAFYVNTGHVLPESTNAVIMIEHINVTDDTRVTIEAPAFPWQNVRKMGEDIVATELLFPRNHVITPYCIGALLSGGIFKVAVREKPGVLIIPTGSELVDWRKSDLSDLKPGQVFETNSFILGSLTESCGGTFERNEMLSDNLENIIRTIDNAVSDNYHIVLTVGGSSAGSEDFTRHAIESIGKILIHGVTMMPGKPVIVGNVRNKPVIGIPGYPVSAIVAFEQIVQPLIAGMLGRPDDTKEKIQVEPTRKITSKLGVEEFLRVKLGRVDDRVVATPMPRGAGCITTITEADGIIRIPNNVEGLKEHTPVTAELLSPLQTINNTVVIVGSHDNTLDILSDELMASHSHTALSSSHVGSMGGLMAIKRGVCHVAGSHLLDENDGTYNLSYIKKYLPDMEIRLVNLVFRDQGLIVPPGNPKGIKGIEDLAREDITFINRQGGSGTRILLDYRLKQLGINPSNINGYENDEFTHMSVAVSVLSGRTDVGLGIYAAAKALDLDFVPVVTEQYDLVIPQKYFETKNIISLLDTINTDRFKKRVNGLGGYSTEKTGKVIL